MAPIKEFPIEKEYERNPDIRPQDIAKLREWVMTQPHLPGKYLTDQDLLIAFHCCQNSAEVAKQVLDLHYTLRTVFKDFFKDRCVDKKSEICLDTVLYAMLPTPTVHGYRAAYVRLLDYDPRNFLFVDAVRTFQIIFDLWQLEEGTFPGFVLIIDCENAVLGHLAKVDLMSLRQIVYFLQECMLIRLQEVHFINAPVFMDKVMMLLKPLIKKSLIHLLHIHQPGSQEIYDFVPKEAFPKEEGGLYKDHNTIRDEVIKKLENNKQFIKEENRRRVNEALRPSGKTTTIEALFGIQGSFKKLDID